MLRSVHITRLLAALLLLVFALSITPKRFLHDAFAKHTDSKHPKSNDRLYQLSVAGYNCDNDNLVAESNFVSDLQIFSFPVFAPIASYVIKNISFTSTFGIYSRLRGPPVNI